MSTKTLTTSLFLIGVLALAGAALPTGWDYDVDPVNPAAGDTLDVDVIRAPSTPVTVELWIGGALHASQSVDPLPGTATFTIPAGTTGKSFEVKLRSSGGNESETGIIG